MKQANINIKPKLAVPFFNLGWQQELIKAELLAATERVLIGGKYILGEEVDAFEAEFAADCGTRYAVGVANGTEAIILTLKALGIGLGDEVITAPNSYLASAAAIALTGATPVFVDVGADYNLNPQLLPNAITPRTKAILPVHLTGKPAQMPEILAIAQRYNLAVIEDASQAVGAMYNRQKVGSFGIAGCFSLHPLKNLNACGDGGIITTNDENLYRYLLKARNHGLQDRDRCEFWSYNSRLDTLQAALLRVKLKYLPAWTEVRRANAQFYRQQLSNLLIVPQEKPEEYAVYCSFVIQSQQRDALQSFLAQREIETKIHYPIPIHLQAAAQNLGYKLGDFPVTEQQAQTILSLPVYPELSIEQRQQVVSTIQEFYC
jgi:dTDP-4-amino-4,6-dideoxygalactose transaminase